MIGREAYHNPWWLARWDTLYFGTSPQELSREGIEETMVDYMAREHARYGTPWPSIARHMLGLRHGLRGARLWRQVWSDHHLKDWSALAVMQRARAAQEAVQAKVANEPEPV